MANDNDLNDKEDKEKREDVESGEQKSYQKILEQLINNSLGELNRQSSGLFMSGFSAGLDVSFSVLLMAVMHSLADGVLPSPVAEILSATMYSIGFIFVILGRSELFTEHTTLAVLPVLHGVTPLKRLFRLWSLIYVGNILGTAVFAVMATVIAPALSLADPDVFGMMAAKLSGYSWGTILLSATLAGWMMGLLGWLVAAARDTVGQILIIWLVTSAIGLGHLHHSIVGSTEMLAGLFAVSYITPGDYVHFLVWSTLGNIIGGSFFVALIKYGHVMHGSHAGKGIKIQK